jgi:hypothetical protein
MDIPTIIGNMQLDHPLRVITPTVDADVLSVLARADRPFTGRGVQRLVGDRSEAGVRRTLDRLVQQGIVVVEIAGASKLYRLNQLHLAAPHIRAMANLKAELVERLREQIAGWVGQPQFAALFGSAVRGEMRTDSDIDVLVIRPDDIPGSNPIWTEQREDLERTVSAWTGNDTRILELTTSGAQTAVTNGDPMLVDVGDHGVALFGPSNYLRTLVLNASIN